MGSKKFPARLAQANGMPFLGALDLCLFVLASYNFLWLPATAAAALTPIFMRATARAFPARRPDPGEMESLRPKYSWLELTSQAAAALGITAAIVLFIFIVPIGNTPWLLGVGFGWMTLAPILLIALFTLPHGLVRWREFWRFYELNYQTSIRVYGSMFAVGCMLGIVSTAVVLFRLFTGTLPV